jgi:hypothetical protein
MLKEITLKYRRIPIVAFHMALIVLANYLAFWIRFDGVIPADEKEIMLRMIPWPHVRAVSALQRAVAVYGNLGPAQCHRRGAREHRIVLHHGPLDIWHHKLSSFDIYH